MTQRRAHRRRPVTATAPPAAAPAAVAGRFSRQPAPERHLHRVRADRRAVRGAHRRRRCCTPQNISNIVVQNSYILILAIGMILIIIAGHIDLSAGSVVAVTGAISAVLMVNHARAVAAGGARHARRGRADRRVAGLLGRLLRHPGVHRHAGRHAGVPRAHADRAGQPGHRPVPGRGPHAVQRLHRRATWATSGSARSAAPTCSRCWSGWSRWPAIVGHAVARPRGPDRLRPDRRRRCRCSSRRSSLAVAGRDVRRRAAGPVQEPAVGAGAARGPGPRLHAADQPGGVRPPHLRRRRQPAGGRRCPASRSSR